MPKTRPYLFYDVALSICSTCYRKVERPLQPPLPRLLRRQRP
jgi:hypothetical protein